MEIIPILSSLRKHSIPALLIICEVALACAVMCNAVFMISEKMTDVRLVNNIDEQSISVVTIDGGDPDQAVNAIPRDLDLLRGIPGVSSASVTNTLPLTDNTWQNGFSAQPGEKRTVNTSTYFLASGAERSLGLRLLRGRWFNDDEYAGGKLNSNYSAIGHTVIVTDSYAKRVWPNDDALGKTLYSRAGDSYQVVGIIADVLAPSMTVNSGNRNGAYWSAFFPLAPTAGLNYYVIHSDPSARDRIIRAAVDQLSSTEPRSVVKGQTFEAIRDDYFASTESTIWILVLVCATMLMVTAFGIVGLSSFWVRQRRRQIGIRRALGARRYDILTYFQTENLLLTAIGVIVGMGLAYGGNVLLSQHYEVGRMPMIYLPASALVIAFIGQLSVLGPAVMASTVTPVAAIRTNG